MSRFGPGWVSKTERLNEGMMPHIGDQVIDEWGCKGVVVKILRGDEFGHGGTIYVWQSERTGYGIDNCEHYGMDNWRSVLRIVKAVPREKDTGN